MAYNVMVVDDAAMMRLYLSSFLNSRKEFKLVAQAANGQEALDKLPDLPDLHLILLDIEMPVMDGLEFLRHAKLKTRTIMDGLEFLRHAKLKTRAKICMLSSVTVQGSPLAAKARELGADGVVSKPSGTVSHDLEEKTGDELTRVMRTLVGA